MYSAGGVLLLLTTLALSLFITKLKIPMVPHSITVRVRRDGSCKGSSHCVLAYSKHSINFSYCSSCCCCCCYSGETHKVWGK